jgi:hypothetical protein
LAVLTASITMILTQSGVATAGSVLPSSASSTEVIAFGTSAFYGAPDASQLNDPIVGMASTADGNGYWLVAADGGIFTFGDAHYYGSEGGTHLNQPIVGMAATPDGNGYWLVAADGGIFTFGDAHYYGSEGGTHLNQPIVGMAATPDGDGYWLAAADGGVFTFGNAQFFGSEGELNTTNLPVVGIAATPDGDGYWLAAANGTVFNFKGAGDEVPSEGTIGSQPIVGIAANPTGGYWLTTSVISVPPPSDAVPGVVAACNVADPQSSVKPSAIVLDCGNDSASLENITWSSWTAPRALGTGTYVVDSCIPDCAEGTLTRYPGTTIMLSAPWKIFAKYEFSTATFTYAPANSAGAHTTETAPLTVASS